LKKGITLIAVLVGVLSITSGAFAAHHYLITSSSQIKNGVVRISDLTPAARKALHGRKGSEGIAGPQGPAGVQGPKGDAGAAGARGLQGSPGFSGYEVRSWRYSKDDANSDAGPGYVGVGSGAIATVACSPGKVAISGGYRFTENGFNSSAVSDGSGIVSSFPGRMDWSTNTVKPNDNSGWIVQVNNKVNAADMTLYAICVNAN
jgi:hypothetical protein